MYQLTYSTKVISIVHHDFWVFKLMQDQEVQKIICNAFTCTPATLSKFNTAFFLNTDVIRSDEPSLHMYGNENSKSVVICT